MTEYLNTHNASLLLSAANKSHYPQDDLPEIALAGRSNVGKSSFINTMINRKSLARTSSEPGKTRQINFYNIDEKFYFVDLPGYGFSKMSKQEQGKVGKFIEQFLVESTNIALVLFLIDIRHSPTENDMLMYNFLKYYNLPVTVVATKADKVGGSKKEKQLKDILRSLDLVVGDDLVVFSSVTKLGVKEVLKKIEDLVDTVV